jgi:SHS2 domain-containing protein
VLKKHFSFKNDYNLFMPFEALPHTADWCLRAWAADLEQLFVEAAKGMYTLSGTRLALEPRVERTFTTSAEDAESLLVAFLSELIFIAEQETLAFNKFELHIDSEGGNPIHLSVVMQGATILSIEKGIKAVTFHNMQIQQTQEGYEVEIVFDV